MKLPNSFVKWMRELMADLAMHRSAPDIPSPPPPPPPPAPPEPSCFAKGIARSLAEQGDKDWGKADSSYEGWVPTPVLHVQHHVHKVRVIAFPFKTEIAVRAPLPGCQHIGSIVVQDVDTTHSYAHPKLTSRMLTDAEATLIARAIESNPFGTFKTTLEREQNQRQAETERERYFSALGCPPSTPIS